MDRFQQGPSRVTGKVIRKSSGMFGFSHLYGGYAGGQAEFVRVPKANVGPLVLPPDIADEKVLFLSIRGLR